MLIYIYDNFYEDILDNTLMHIYNMSCGPTMALCMKCRKEIKPTNENMNRGLDMSMNRNEGPKGGGSFFFIMCASCRTDAQEKEGGIPNKSTQRRLIENFLAKWQMHENINMHMQMNPYSYANVYVVSVENGVEILLLVANMA